MKEKLKLISSFISLLITAFLCITCVYGWYIASNNSTASGINASTKKAEFEGGSIERLLAVKDYVYDSNGNISEEKYKLGANIDTSDTSLSPYDLVFNDVDYVIYHISFTSTKDTYKLRLTQTETSTETISEDRTSGTTTYYNYLSNVADFYYLTLKENTEDTYVCSAYPGEDSVAAKNLGYCKDLTNAQNYIDILSGNIESESDIYLLFKYNDANIKTLIDKNSSVLFEEVYFKENLKFELVEEE